MKDSVFLRLLTPEDALTSCKWRNNPKVWELTGTRPDTFVTPEMEVAWLTDVLSRTNEKRFAICLAGSGQYIGNIYISNIDAHKGELAIFLGEPEFWGKGIGTEAMTQIIKYAFDELHLELVYGFVRHEHVSSQAMLRKLGFTIAPFTDELLKVDLSKTVFQSIKKK